MRDNGFITGTFLAHLVALLQQREEVSFCVYFRLVSAEQFSCHPYAEGGFSGVNPEATCSEMREENC